jgi:DNA repair protein RadC
MAEAPLMRELPADERPRERLERYGPGALSVAELLAILLRVGSAQGSALQLAQQLTARFGSLKALATATVHELGQTNGVGLAKACQLKAAFELGKRLAASTDGPRPVIASPASAAQLVMEEMRYFAEEHFRILILNTRHQVLAERDISVGSLNASLVHPRETFRAAIAQGAAALVLLHNHPSGDPTPSADDLALTARLAQAGQLLGIPILDHLVIGDGRYVSLREQGLLEG